MKRTPFYVLANCLRQSDCALISDDTLCQNEPEDVDSIYAKCLCFHLDQANSTTGLCIPDTEDLVGALEEKKTEEGTNLNLLYSVYMYLGYYGRPIF